MTSVCRVALHARRVFRVACPTLLALLCSCSQDARKRQQARLTTVSEVFEQRYYGGPLCYADLVGAWVLDVECVPYLVKTAKRSIYTNRSDHVMLLNADGSAIVRGMVGCATFPPYNAKSERDEYELWIGERDGHPAMHVGGYYIWNPRSDTTISGPFSKRPVRVEGEVLKTRETQWYLRWMSWEDMDRTEAGWAVVFSHGRSMLVGKVSGRLCLWCGFYEPWTLDEVAKTFRYSRVSDVELRAIARGSGAQKE